METGLPFVSLWCEKPDAGKLRILSREVTLTVPLPALEANHRAIEEFLPALAQSAPSPDTGVRWLLLLEPSLPDTWQALHWESFNLSGRPLSSQALVVRKAVWSARQNGDGQIIARFIDLFPPDEFSFGERLERLTRSGQLLTSRRQFLEKDMATVTDLFIMAHGRANGLIDAAGNLFDIPSTHPMPERIWLLACNVDGTMDKLAQRLLEQGCRTVIAATSDLEAVEMARLVERLFAQEHPLEEYIRRLARADRVINRDGGLHALTVWGHVDVDRSPCSFWNRVTWDEEHGIWRRPPLDDTTAREDFFAAHTQAMSQHAWPVTCEWMLPSLLLRAERHDHPTMQALVVKLGGMESPLAIRALAAAARRVGHYPAMARYLSKGLALPDLTANERADYLGELANLFIDLDLPGSAATAIELHEDCHLNYPKDQAFADFKRLDWMARMEARRGRFRIALDLMTTKRKRADPDDSRELAGQLYLSTWGCIAGQVSAQAAVEFAVEATGRLSRTCPQDVTSGNDTNSYLLRALAAHSWMAGDNSGLDLTETWLAYAQTRLIDDDPGPWAYTVAFLHLRHATTPEMFDRAVSALARAHYYLEAAAISGFAGRVADCERFLGRFQRRRKDAFAEMKKSDGVEIARAMAESDTRARIESDASFHPAEAARIGIFPL